MSTINACHICIPSSDLHWLSAKYKGTGAALPQNKDNDCKVIPVTPVNTQIALLNYLSVDTQNAVIDLPISVTQVFRERIGSSHWLIGDSNGVLMRYIN